MSPVLAIWLFLAMTLTVGVALIVWWLVDVARAVWSGRDDKGLRDHRHI